MFGLRRRRGFVENVIYFDSDDELEKKKKHNVHINIDTIKTYLAKTNLNIDKDSVKTCAQILIEILLIDLPISHMRIQSIARGVVNMICD